MSAPLKRRLVGSNRWRTLAVASLVSALLTAACGSATGSSGSASSTTIPPLPTLDSTIVDDGRQVYAQNCASCHGANAEGAPEWQQSDEQGDRRPPPHDDSGHTWRHGDGELFDIVKNGWRDPFNKTTDLTMPPFGDTLTDEQIQAVVTYFKSLWSDEHRRYQRRESQDQPFPSPVTATPGATP